MISEISIVVPVYNSSAILPELVRRIRKTMMDAALTYQLILTDDCSTDDSWRVICDLSRTDSTILGLRLSKNSGQWSATLAGVSRASGRYIVTIDDDLEYDPTDIPKLYSAIKANDYYVVFGMPKEKYHLQGKSETLSTWRKNLVYTLWNSPVTESFRIFPRTLVLDGDRFLPTVYIDAYIVNAVERRFIGYVEVGFNRRFAGTSNITFLRKAQLFLLFGFHFSLYRVNNLILLPVLLLICILATFILYAAPAGRNPGLSIFSFFLILSSFFNLYYFRFIYRKINQFALFLIIEDTRQKNTGHE